MNIDPQNKKSDQIFTKIYSDLAKIVDLPRSFSYPI